MPTYVLEVATYYTLWPFRRSPDFAPTRQHTAVLSNIGVTASAAALRCQTGL